MLTEEEKASRLQHGWRVCEWCREPTIPPEARANRITCSKRCRQAKARFNRHIRRASSAEEPMHFAYADPPYPGLSKRYYGDHRDFNGEVDHEELVSRLTTGPYDGWALSTSAEALRDVWALCPPETRLCVWVNGPRKTKSFTALHAYEAVLVWGGRVRQVPVVEDLSDVLLWGGRQHSHPGALVGMKPAAFCGWLFELLGASRGDRLDDFFPGSGAVRRAWDLFTSPQPGSDDTSRGPDVAAAGGDTSRLAGRGFCRGDPHDGLISAVCEVGWCVCTPTRVGCSRPVTDSPKGDA